MSDNILDELVEIELASPGQFLQVKETLTRIGVSSESNNEKKLFPSVLILHKRGRYYLVPFKAMFILDGGQASISETDWKRYFTICHLLKSWGLVSILNPELYSVEEDVNIRMVKIVPYQEKDQWTIVNKYTIGNKTR